MDVERSGIEGVVVLRPAVHHDARGWFTRTLDEAVLRGHGLHTSFVQHNQSRSHRAVLRGMHVRGGEGEVKMVRVASGRIVDFVADLRPESATYGAVERIELDDADHAHLYLPPHVAHGYQVLSDSADVCYLHSRAYDPTEEECVRWDDEDLGIPWPLRPPVLSDRDAAAPRLRDVRWAGAGWG